MKFSNYELQIAKTGCSQTYKTSKIFNGIRGKSPFSQFSLILWSLK